MRKIVWILFLFVSFGLFAQENIPESSDSLHVKRAAIYPGCDNSSSDNIALVRCFNQAISKDIVQNMDSFEMEPDDPTIRIPVHLLINKDGKLDIVKIEDSLIPSKFKTLVKKALLKYQNYMRDKFTTSYGIKPAIDLEGNPVEIKYTINLTFQPPSARGKVNPLEKGRGY